MESRTLQIVLRTSRDSRRSDRVEWAADKRGPDDGEENGTCHRQRMSRFEVPALTKPRLEIDCISPTVRRNVG